MPFPFFFLLLLLLGAASSIRYEDCSFSPPPRGFLSRYARETVTIRHYIGAPAPLDRASLYRRSAFNALGASDEEVARR